MQAHNDAFLCREMCVRLHWHSMVIAIEGTIGAGKSECIECLRRMTDLTVRQEPVEKWARFLDAAYDGKGGHVALQIRIMLDTCIVRPDEHIVERSPAWQHLTFIPAMASAGYIAAHEEAMLQELHQHLTKWRPEQTIYLRCSKEETLRRIQQRNRGAECKLNLAYIAKLHDLYEQTWKEHFPYAVVIDTTSTSPEAVAAQIIAWLNGRSCR